MTTEPDPATITQRRRAARVAAVCRSRADSGSARGGYTAARHLLVVESHQLLICAIPKVGTRFWKKFVQKVWTYVFFRSSARPSLRVCNLHDSLPAYYLCPACLRQITSLHNIANNNMLEVKRTKAGDCSFAVADASLWNNLPTSLRRVTISPASNVYCRHIFSYCILV